MDESGACSVDNEVKCSYYQFKAKLTTKTNVLTGRTNDGNGEELLIFGNLVVE